MNYKIEIDSLKNNEYLINDFIKTENCGNIISILNHLGKLPKDFSPKPLLLALENDNNKIRYLALKNLAKLSDIKLLSKYKDVVRNDVSANVRREAVSAIGRLRDENTITFLTQLLKDNDPEVVLQAIRGLLVFKKNDTVRECLKSLSNHPNEIIQDVIKKEFKDKNITKNIHKHSLSPYFLKNCVVQEDVKNVVKLIPDESIHLTFTSPPYYNARDYSIYQSYNEYLEFLESVFKEVHRITKEGRFFILNTSPIIIPRVSRQHSSKRYPIPYDIHPLLIKMGWEFIDDIIWVKPEASVKNRVAGFEQHRKPLAYKPNPRSESIMVYRKKTDKLLDWNIKQYFWETIEKSKIKESYETSNIWEIDPVFDKTHTAVFPIELCNRIIKLYSYIGDLVFDPFGGSGTMAKAAQELQRYFLLTEIKPDYINRIKEKLSQSTFFSNAKFQPAFLKLQDFKKRIEEYK
jgi:DNA modification methylase